MSVEERSKEVRRDDAGVEARSAAETPSKPVTSVARKGDRWIFLGIVLAALILRLVALKQYEQNHPNAHHPVIDEASYDEWARTIARGDWFGHDVFFQEPLYPYALGALYSLGLLGGDPFAARFAQCFVWALAAYFVGLLARRLFGRAAGFVAAIAVALYQPGLIFPNLLLKENLFLPLFVLFALLVVRTRDADERNSSTWRRGAFGWFAVGVAGALGALLRGNMLVLLPIFALWPLARRWFEKRALGAGVAHGAFVLLGCACVLVPVGLRNWNVGGVFVLTTSGAGTNLYGGNNLENPYGRATEFSFIRGIPKYEALDWKREAQRRIGHELDAKQVSEFWRDQVFASVREHPLEHLRILANKARLTLGAYEVPDNHMLDWDARYLPIARAPWPRFGLVGALGLAGVFLFVGVRVARRTPNVACVGGATEVAILFALYYGTIVLTVTSDRARLPLVGLLAPFAGWMVVEIWRVARTHRADATLALTAALIAGFTIVHVPVFTASEIAADFDKRDFNLAVQRLDETDKLDEARTLAASLVAAHPDSARLKCLLAEIDWRRASDRITSGNAVERASARASLAEILARIEPIADDARVFARERFRAASLAAWIRLDRGDFAAAESRFAEARAFDPDDRTLKLGHVRALLGVADSDASDRIARIDKARALLEELRATVPPIPTGRAALHQDVYRARYVDEVQLDLWTAQAEFQLGRELLAGNPDETRRKRGQDLVRTALDRLNQVCQTDLLDVYGRARALAGWIQLYLGNAPAAERHFRASHRDDRSTNGAVGLARALLLGAEKSENAEDRAAKIHEARAIADAAAIEDPDSPALADLRARLEKL